VAPPSQAPTLTLGAEGTDALLFKDDNELICDAEKDLFFQGQAQQLFERLTCPRTFMMFTDADGAGAHCEAGASRLAYARMYDWLDETLPAVK
jgi:hypothetical protein